jgi:hypothetical protein
MTLTSEERGDLLEAVRILKHVQRHDDLAGRLQSMAARMPDPEPDPALRRKILALMKAYMHQAVDAELELLLRWPGDTPYDGGEEEADARGLQTIAATFRVAAKDLAEILP